MEINVGPTDRTVRLIAGSALLGAGFLLVHGPVRWVLRVFGLALVATGLKRSCLLYQVLGINTNESPGDDE